MIVRTEVVNYSSPSGRTVELHLGNWRLSEPRGALLFHHGTPGWGFPGDALLDACAERSIRVIGVTRAGYSESMRHQGRTISAIADDVRSILDWLEIESVLVAGVSGGGPHALGTAAMLPDRVIATASISGLGQFGASDLDFLSGMGDDNLDEFGAAVRGEAALRAYLQGEAPKLVGVSADDIAHSMVSLLPSIDSELVTGSLAEEYVTQFSESLKTGVYGWLDDDIAFVKGWGFDLRQLTSVPVSVWQGGLDLMVPEAHGRWLAKHIPHARQHLLPQDGHLSVIFGRAQEIIDELASYL